MERLLKKFETAKEMVPAPQMYQSENRYDTGIIFYGTSTYSAEEALDTLKEHDIHIDAMRLKSFPFNHSVEEFIKAHKKVYVVEQNRDAQMKSLLTIELQVNPAKLISVLNFDGMPITAEAILRQISPKFQSGKHTPKPKKVS
jgi:2-oxoglutarate ferredoxin oxidoreductase subunit alpha